MNRLVLSIFAMCFVCAGHVGLAAWEDLTEQERALLTPYARGRLVSPVRLNPWALEAAGEYCRDNGLDFRTALPGVWVRNSVLFAGPLPAARGSRERKWGVLYTDEGLRGEIPWSVGLIILHPKGGGPRPATPEERVDYAANCAGFDSGKSGGYGIVPWLEREGDGLAVVVLDQGRPYAAIRPWVWQTVTRLQVRADGIHKVWEKSANMHEANWMMSDTMRSFSINGQRPRPLHAKPVTVVTKTPPAHDAAAELQNEMALIAPYARSPMLRVARGKIDDSTQPALLEAAGEYCRANKLNFADALPRIWTLHSVIVEGDLPLEPGDGGYRPVVVYRRHAADPNDSLRLSVLLLREEPDAGKKPRHQPLVYSIEATGFRSDSTIIWPDSDSGKPGVMLLQQTEPSPKQSWYRQSVAFYEFSKKGFRRSWKETAELHAVNFSPIRELPNNSHQHPLMPVEKTRKLNTKAKAQNQ